MLADSLIVPECVYRPGSFTGLMTIYESNYIKLSQLTTKFDWAGWSMMSRSRRDNDLHAQLMRRVFPRMARVRTTSEALGMFGASVQKRTS